MSEDQHLQALLDKIHSEGVVKAETKAAEIVAAAEARAARIVADAEQSAREFRERAERDAAAFAERASESVRQVARDVVLSVSKGVTEQLEGLLLSEGRVALSVALVESAVSSYLSGGISELEVVVGESAAESVEALRQGFAARAVEGVSVTLDKSTGAGFRVRLDGGRVEHDFTAAAITGAIASRLRPQLAGLLQAGDKG